MGRPKKYDSGYSSVTEVIGLLNKPYLVPWAAKLCSETIGNLLKYNIDGLPIDDILLRGKQAPNAVKDHAGDFGTKIHGCVERYLKGEPVVLLNEAEQKVFDLFIAYCKEKVHKVAWQEEPIYDDENKFAGTPDLISQDKDGNYILHDWKIKNQIDKFEIALQFGGYALLCKKQFGKLPIRCECFCVNREGEVQKSPEFIDVQKLCDMFLNLLKVSHDKKAIKTVD